LLGKLHCLRFDFLRQGAFTLREPRNLSSRHFRLIRGPIALSLKCAVLLCLFFGLFREARNALGQSCDFLPCRFCFFNGELVVCIELVCPATEGAAFLAKPSNFSLSLGQYIWVSPASCRSHISSKGNA
jgi:hypothetical protein